MSAKHPLLKKLIASLEDSKAIDIIAIDVREQTTVTDYMVICTGRSSRHVKAIAQQLMEDMKNAGLSSLSDTGLNAGEWALIDFADFVVHVMQPDIRSFYNIEGLWQDKSEH